MVDSQTVSRDVYTPSPPASPIMVPERIFNPNGPGASRNHDPSRIKAILTLPTIPEQIDAFARLRNFFMHEPGSPSYALLLEYMSEDISLQEAVDRIAEPIEELWRTGDHCTETRDEEDENHSWMSAVGSLMDLWYGVMHVARRTPWSLSAEQDKVITLVQAFKTRPAPTRSEEQQATIEKLNPHYWDESEGMLWDGLPWYGLCSAEVRNDGGERQIPEGMALANLSGYKARLALAEDEFQKYNQELDALCDALEWVIEPWVADALVPAAAVGVLILREKIWEKSVKGSYHEKVPGPINCSLPGRIWVDRREQKTIFSKERWMFWKKRFGDMASDEKLRLETSQIAGLAVEVMNAVEMGEDGKDENL
jgi:hypothetical protein